MERQYIGARYVPKFFENPSTGDSAWMAGVAYEALTIVTYAGNSYTSKKPVPAGTGAPNANPTYWVSTGNFNEQIESIREEVESLGEDVAENTDRITELETNTNKARQFILVGDSFGAGVDGDNNTQKVAGGGWIQRFKDAVNGWAEVYNNQIPLGGVYGFASSRPFLEVLQDAEQYVPDKSLITDIVVLGGTNDVGINASTVISKIQQFVSYCHTNYPKARIAIGCLGSNIYQMVQLGENAYSHCIDYGAEYIKDLRALYCLKNYVGADNVHLNASGYAFYTPYINEAILTGFSDWSFQPSTQHNILTIDSNSPITSGDTLGLGGRITNKFYLLGVVAKSASGVSAQGFAHLTNASQIANGYYKFATQGAITGVPVPFQRAQALHTNTGLAEMYFDDTGALFIITRDAIPANTIITGASSNMCPIPY